VCQCLAARNHSTMGALSVGGQANDSFPRAVPPQHTIPAKKHTKFSHNHSGYSASGFTSGSVPAANGVLHLTTCKPGVETHHGVAGRDALRRHHRHNHAHSPFRMFTGMTFVKSNVSTTAGPDAAAAGTPIPTHGTHEPRRQWQPKQHPPQHWRPYPSSLVLTPLLTHGTVILTLLWR
jgi:hypothetical protein